MSPNTNISSRLLIEADAWAHFRVRSFAFRLHPSATVRSSQSLGFCGGIQDTPPSTIAQIGELLPAVFLAAGATVPTEWVHIKKQELAGPLPWYKTIPGTADATEESPGVLAWAGTASDVMQIEFRGVFEFKTAVAAGNTPLALAAKVKLREERIQAQFATERALLLKILGSASVGVASTPRIPP